MKTDHIQFAGDVPGIQVEMRVLRFEGADTNAPTAYLQSSLHGAELPGQAALHFLIPMLRKAEEEGRIKGDITIVPQANPVASNQWQSHQHLGRFDFFSGVNFNRNFPLLENFDTSALPQIDAPVSLDKRIKAMLVRMALKHEIVLDLHCDDESENYLYVHENYAEDLRDLATALRSTAILAGDSTVSAAFEEACVNPLLHMKQSERDMRRRAVTTVEFRGLNDVDPATGLADAEGLYRFLVHRGVVEDASSQLGEAFSGPIAPFSRVEMIRAPQGGMVLYHVALGDIVKKGDLLATIVTVPGEPEHDIKLCAPQAGRVLTYRSLRYLRRGDDVMKLIGDEPSAQSKPAGSLEA
ncbi:succinylglutamate desuccinylase/aspartoacylase family protein [Ochrobactrum sp. SFR4]|uniref:succinylglutamate desuccinylase/aspartoacylase family protein n=1 Tax=Ochrobactrum sp. SFR4 TaxID=2717368 RepID=UPI000EFC7DAA|nr:succinylglutamate desuccinylase/aspartoacylase family protein [Ochrobactrum sp. SFR4]MBX8824289.1 succinylglutamate desuccinylase/aspartoacylase family protein [Ochrobactrum sp. SFR4]